MDNITFLAGLTVGQFKSFRKSVAVLMRCGIDRFTATDMVLTAMQNRQAVCESFRRHA